MSLVSHEKSPKRDILSRAVAHCDLIELAQVWRDLFMKRALYVTVISQKEPSIFLLAVACCDLMELAQA